MKKSALKALKLTINWNYVKPWGPYFWCPRFEQQTCLAVCNNRRFMVDDFPVYQPCVKCEIRKHSFRVLRNPRLPKRTPRTK